MNVTKVASTTLINDRLDFHEWLDTLPFHTPILRRLDLWADAMSRTSVVWIADPKGGEEFFFY